MRFLFLMFVILPIVEMWLLIEVGTQIGTLPTIGMVLLTAVIGASLLRSQGLHTLTRAQQRLNSGEIPATEILEGLMLAVSGALLLTPGFVTDAIGFCCLVPALRQAMAAKLLKQGVLNVQGQQYSRQGGNVRFEQFSSTTRHGAGSPPDSGAEPGNITVEGDFRRED